MPKSDINEHFEQERPEWTERKHALAARYFIPAAMKMKTINGAVALIDGYAGPNSYQGEIKGSTVIMVDAAKRVRAQGAEATVFACEPHSERFLSLKQNLAPEIDQGILSIFNRPHADCVSEIQKQIGRAAALVFLDPQTASEMTLEGDIYPWAARRSTDVLGVFMGGDACRVCASLLATNPSSLTMLKSLGPGWPQGVTEDGAYNVFFDALSGKKHFSGLYRLRKQEPRKSAYGIFGLSDSVHGIWLLSEAIAKDWGVLKIFDAAKRTPNLFTDIEEEENSAASFDRLLEVCRPVLAANKQLTGDKLGMAVMKNPRALSQTFGRYVATDFTKAARAISQEKL